MPESVLEWGIRVVLALQAGLGEWLIGPMNVFTVTGYPEFYLLVFPAIYWSYDNRLGLRLVIILMLSTVLSLVLKMAWHDPRPYWVDTRVQLWAAPEKTYGIPSTHAQNSVVFWGMFAAHLKKGWVWGIMIAIMFFTGFSRIYLGVHFPTDVFVGWSLGLMALFLFLGLENFSLNWLQQWAKWPQVGLVFVLSLILIVIGALVSHNVSSSLPPEWLQDSALVANTDQNPLSLDDILTVMGTLFGLSAGVILFGIGFDPGGPWVKRVGRYVVGFIGILILWRGLGFGFGLLAWPDTLLAYSLRYIRYALLGAWVSALAPMMFIRLGLVESISNESS